MLSDASEAPHEQTTGLRFLITGDDGEPFRRTRCWIRREPGLSMDDWSLHLTEPGRSDVVMESDVVEIDDLKRWALFKGEEYRYLGPEGRKRAQASDLRRLHSEVVLEKYLQAVMASLPATKQSGPVWCLIPAVGDVARRKRYRTTIQRALPGARILHEPEMVVEYFRLVRRELTLEENKSSIFLVIDAGASTCNMTFVLTRRDQKVIDASTGVARKASLRAKQGDAPGTAGRWVDEELGRLLGLHWQLMALTHSVREDALRAIEAAKLKATRAGTPAMIEHAALEGEHVINRDHLVCAAEHLWDRLTPVYLDVAEQFLADVQRGADGKYFRERLEAHGVKDASGVQHLIDGVILAGGTSQLPGFRESMLTHIFSVASDIKLHTVGDDYSIAAATGALAHVLHQHHRPSRLSAAPETDSPNSLASATFHGTPTTDIFLAWRRPGGAEQKVQVLDRDDDFVQTGGSRPVEGLPAFDAGEEIQARLLPDVEYSFIGLSPQDLLITAAPGRMSLVWNTDLQEASVKSDQVRGSRALHLALSNLCPEPGVPIPVKPQPEARLWTDGASDVIIDLGMSKTVVVSAEPGPFITPFGPASHGRRARPVLSRSEILISEVPASEVPASEVLVPEVPVFEVPVSEIQVSGVPPEQSPPRGTPFPPMVVLPLTPRTAASPVIVADGRGSAQEAVVLPFRSAPAPIDEFGPALARALGPLSEAKLHATVADLTMLVLALSVRPFVLLAGPPGSGKSTLVRLVARLLGLEDDCSFFEITVQPHWRTEEAIPADARRAWEVNSQQEQRLFLFDEINLTRPEHYLMPFFRRMDRQGQGGPLLACGTLNIDDASRPPSPKVIDRCFLMEIDAPRAGVGAGAVRAIRNWTGGSLTSLPALDDPTTEQHSHIADTIAVIRSRAGDGRLRQDLLPSHRDEADLSALITAYRSTRIPDDLLAEDDLVDRALAGRVLVKLAGAADQVRPLVEDLSKHFEKYPTLTRCRRRIALASSQLEQLGFVAPWQ